MMCSFHLRLFTRERQSPSQTSSAFEGDDQVAKERSTSAGLGAGGLTAARPVCSRVLRVEPLTHTIMTSPGWRTLLLTWNDHTQSWIKTGNIMQRIA